MTDINKPGDSRSIPPAAFTVAEFCGKPTVRLSITHKCLNLRELRRHKNLEANESLVIPC